MSLLLKVAANGLKQLKSITHLRRHVWAAFYISMGGFLNGYDTGSIGSITGMPHFQTSIAKLSPTMTGLVVSFLLLSGALPSLFAGAYADKLGHLRVILAGAVAFTVGAVLEAAAPNLAVLIVGRGLVGIGEGLYLGNLNVYICEIAPKARRGTLVALPQALATLGTCLGYFTCYFTIKIPSDMQWRIPFIIQAGGGLLLALTCCCLPESPRWLLSRQRRDEALQSMKYLDFKSSEITEDFSEPTQNAVPHLSWQGIATLFSRKHRFRTSLALFILGMVQLCGIDGVLYYAPTLFAQAGLPASTASFVASGISGILMFLISIPAFLLADTWGRRTVVIVGGVLLTGCMATIGALYASDNVLSNAGAGRWVVIVLIFVFALTYVSTWGMVGKIYASEIQPSQTRATANALAQSLNFLTNFLTAFITPIFLTRSSSGPYFLFASFTFLTLAILWFYMPETRGRSLESIQTDFKPPHVDKLERLELTTLHRRRHNTTNAVHDDAA